jgi:hypothetical protein
MSNLKYNVPADEMQHSQSRGHLCDWKLSKQLFMNLPDGVFLASNGATLSPLGATFAEYVAPAAQRGDQWLKIKAAKADQRLCHLHDGKESFDEFLNQWK